MEENRLNELITELDYCIDHAPIEDDCTDAQNKMYSDMDDLKNSIEAVIEESKNGWRESL